MKAIALTLVVAGCTSQYHVRLPPPSPTITPEERVAMFWKMRPITEGTQTFNGNLVNETIMLADKTEVVSPEDLEPLVGDDSETMSYARASVHARHKATVTYYASFTMAAAGLLMAFVLPVPLPVELAGGGLFIASFLPYFMERHYTRVEIELRRKAWQAYPADLGKTLNVCAHGTQVVPCEGPLPPDQPPSVPPGTTTPDRTGTLRMRDDSLATISGR